MKAKAVIFDLDDTLLKTKQVRYGALKHAGEHFYNQLITSTEIDNHWGEPLETFFFNIFDTDDSYNKIFDNYKSILKDYPSEAYEDVFEVLQYLSTILKVCILSSSPKKLILADIRNAGIPLELFSYIQGAEDTNIHKPNPRVFDPLLRYLRKYGVGAEECIYVGDSIDDYIAASKAGIRFIGIAERTIKKGKFIDSGADVISSLTELLDVITVV